MIQPYIDIIDEEFIEMMNQYVQNIAMYVNPNHTVIGNLKINFDTNNDKKDNAKEINKDNTE